METKFIICNNCGTRNFADDKICGVCKAKLEGRVYTQLHTKSTEKSRPVYRLGTFGSILFSAAIIAAYSVNNGYEQDEDEKRSIARAYQDDIDSCFYNPKTKHTYPVYSGLVGYIKPDSRFNTNFEYPWFIPTIVQIGPDAYSETTN